MKTEIVKLSQIQVNGANPRAISNEKFEKLINSVLVLPKMLDIRHIVVDDTMTVLGGNMRYRALVAISEMTEEDIIARLDATRDYKKKTDAERALLIAWWREWLKSPFVEIIRAANLSADEQREFIIKDNVSFGSWDMDMLANEWDAKDLDDWGADVWQDNEDVGISLDECTDEFSLPAEEKGNVEVMSFVLTTEQAEFIRAQINISQYDDEDTFGNTNKNGNAIYAIVKQWADVKK